MAHIREIDLRVDQECVGYISNDCTEDSFLGVEKFECFASGLGWCCCAVVSKISISTSLPLV